HSSLIEENVPLAQVQDLSDASTRPSHPQIERFVAVRRRQFDQVEQPVGWKVTHGHGSRRDRDPDVPLPLGASQPSRLAWFDVAQKTSFLLGDLNEAAQALMRTRHLPQVHVIQIKIDSRQHLRAKGSRMYLPTEV